MLIKKGIFFLIFLSFTFSVYGTVNLGSYNQEVTGVGIDIMYEGEKALIPYFGAVPTDGSSFSFSYQYTSSKNWLSVPKCELSLSNSIITANFDLPSNVAAQTAYDFLVVNNRDLILRNNVYMKVELKATLYQDGSLFSSIPSILPTGLQLGSNYQYGSYPPVPNFVYVTPESNTFSFDLPKNEVELINLAQANGLSGLPEGSYKWVISAQPIDEKCDFSEDGNFALSEIREETFDTITIQIDDEDGDFVLDADDLCLGEFGQVQFSGCQYEYSSLGCSNDANFIPYLKQMRCEDNDWGKRLFFSSNVPESGIQLKDMGNLDSDVLTYQVSQGDGFYSCYDGPLNDEGWRGYCELRHNALQICNAPSIPPTVLAKNTYNTYFKYANILPLERNDVSLQKIISCQGPGAPTLSQPLGQFKFYEPNFLSDDYLDFERNSSGNIILNDDTTQNKIECNYEIEECYYINESGGLEVIPLPNVGSTQLENIKIYKQGINVRNESVDPLLIAMKAHKIKKFSDKEEAQGFVKKSTSLMRKFEIQKHMQYNSFTDKTTVTIKLKNIPKSNQTNLTIYQVFPKEVAHSSDKITFNNDGGAKRFVVDNDPVIGWYFEDPGNETEIEYETENETEGGTIIITQEPILFNEGDLIVNYRESGCEIGEVPLFEIDSLEASNVFNLGSSKLYTICLTFLGSTASINTVSGEISQFIFNYTHSSTLSRIQTLVNEVTIYAQNNSEVYWHLLVQRDNPTGDYSCLGSIDNEIDSLFGDCGYNAQNRLWIHLGEDVLAPTTTFIDPSALSHTVKVGLDAKDNTGGSGVKETFYCVTDTSLGCVPDTLYSEQFVITCPYAWGCTKFIYFASEDVAGNIELIKEKELILLEKGSACQADCTAKPAPNRFIRECRNLNGCSYFPLPTESEDDKGLAVANNCHLLVQGSWVIYNESHEVLCPSGPFRESKFTNTGLSLTGCNDIIKIPFPVIIDGEQIVMSLATCFNPFN